MMMKMGLAGAKAIPGSLALAALALLAGSARPADAGVRARCTRACRADYRATRRSCVRDVAGPDCRDFVSTTCSAIDDLDSCITDKCSDKTTQDAFNPCVVNCCLDPATHAALTSCEDDFSSCMAGRVPQCLRDQNARATLRSCGASCRTGAQATPLARSGARGKGCFCFARFKTCSAPFSARIADCITGCKSCVDSKGHGTLGQRECNQACLDSSPAVNGLDSCQAVRAECAFKFCGGPPPPTTTTTVTTTLPTSTSTTTTTTITTTT
jgi:hypothetical protein